MGEPGRRLGAREDDREALQGYFDFFKHLSAVGTAVLVLVLVLYRDLYIDPMLALLALAGFGVCVVASFYGMFVAMGDGSSQKPRSLLRGLLYVAVAGLGGAVVAMIVGIATSVF